MQLLYTLLLLTLHVLRALLYVARLILELSGLRPPPPPKPLGSARTRVPRHLAIVFKDAREGDEDVMLRSVGRVAEWCREEGVEELSVYDRRGILKTQHSSLQLLLPSPPPTPTAHRPVELPLTPPSSSKPSPPSSIDGLSDTDSPLTLRTSFLRRRPTRQASADADSAEKQELQINVLSWSESKPLIARTALSLALRSRSLPTRVPSPTKPSVSDLDTLLKTSFSAPDLLLVHPLQPRRPSILRPSSLLAFLIPEPLELDGFPPWHVDLSEMYYEPARWRPWWMDGKGEERGVSELEFRRAMEQFERAEMRKGR